MRLTDSLSEHLFRLLHDDVVVPLPGPRPKGQPTPLRLASARRLTVHSSDGSAAEYEQTSEGWRKRPA